MAIVYKNARRGWYKIVNIKKYLPPLDTHMKSFNEEQGTIEYKSGLELKAFRYCDANPNISRWGSESFHIKYIKPTDGKFHRYFIDLFLEFNSNDKFIVEIKSSSEINKPTIPKKQTQKAKKNYNKALQTYGINSAKWKAAEEFAAFNNMKFTFLTEKELG